MHVDIKDRPLKPRRVEVEYLIKRVQDEINRHRGVLSAEALAEYDRALAAYRALLKQAQP